MKKKTFIVQLLDSKQPSRTSFTQVEDANFYSNDTDASLVFIPHEDTFEFQSAKVVMYNRGDESLVERDAIVTTENGRKVASYELPAEIIAHWGDWTAQPVFTSGGEIYSGAIVPFSVIRYLMHERPATLTEIVTVTEFIEQSQALVDDMEQAEAQRVSAEANRASAETQRLSNETVRVSAEAQRKTDHANRSAEFDGKADKVVIKNLIKNGDFRDGLTYWTNPADRVITEIVAEGVKLTSVGERGRLQQLPLQGTGVNDVLYVSAMVKTTDKTVSIADANSPSRYMAKHTGSNEFELLSSTYSIASGAYYPIVILPTADIVAILQWQMAINLTAIFGAGNEPTKEEMDELIKVTGYIDGEYALNNKEMLGYLMKGIGEKANKKQEDWITVPLLNGAQHGESPLKVMKDEMGIVHFKGSLTNLKTGNKIFRLPTGYRPDIGVTESFMRLPVVRGNSVSGMALQLNYVGDGYITNPSDTDISYFDGVSYVAERG